MESRLSFLFGFIIFALINTECLIVNAQNDTNIVLVQIMFRHGVRSVLQNYPSDPTPLSYWNKYGGTGQLTPVGMKQMYDFGLYFKNYYKGFLNSTYDKSRVYARSTDYDRTLSSAYTFLAGLFQPNQNQMWYPDSNISNWLPIPVHTNQLATDTLLHANAPCPKLDYLKSKARNSSEYLTMQRLNQLFLNNMSNLSGINPLDYYHMWEIADNALVDEAHNISLAKWVIENYNKIMIANDYTFYIDFVDIEMAKLVSGPILNEIVTNINKKLLGSTNQLYIYALHDNYIAGMQKLLNTSTLFQQPNFGSAFLFELRNDSNGNYYIKVFYKNDPTANSTTFNLVKVYGCDYLCPLNTFLKLTADKLVTNIEDICSLSANNDTFPGGISGSNQIGMNIFLVPICLILNFLTKRISKI